MFLTGISLVFARALGDLPTPDPPPDAVKDKAKEILRNGQFHGDSSKSLLRRVIDWLSNQLKVPFSAASGGNAVVGFVILIVFFAALAYVLSRIRFGLPSTAKSVEHDFDIDVEEDRYADVWGAEAVEGEAGGNGEIALRGGD